MRLLTIASIAAAALASAAPASAVVTTFASFNPIGNTTNVRWVVSSNNKSGNFSKNATFYTTATANGTSAAARNVNFSFLQAAIAPYATNVTAKFFLSGSVTNTIATVSGGTLTQSNLNGSFSFLSTAPITIGATTFAANSNLLSGNFVSATLSGARNGSAAGLNGSTPTTTISYTSDFLTFTGGANFDMSLGLSSINPLFNATPTAGTPTTAVRAFRAIVGGQFSSDPAPITPAIPEPAIWAQLIIGFSMVGFASRRRKISVAA